MATRVRAAVGPEDGKEFSTLHARKDTMMGLTRWDELWWLSPLNNTVFIVFDRCNPDMRQRARRLVSTLVREWAANGWGEFRTHVALMDKIAATYDFNDGALMRLNETIENALDPNGILSPGKSGVWPRAYDKAKLALGEDYVK